MPEKFFKLLDRSFSPRFSMSGKSTSPSSPITDLSISEATHSLRVATLSVKASEDEIQALMNLPEEESTQLWNRIREESGRIVSLSGLSFE